MSLTIKIEHTGGPEVMQLVDETVAAPGAGQLRVRHAAIGLNFIDVYHRSGVYKLSLPSGLGSEAAGTVTAVGSGVSGFAAGDRIAYVGGPLGAYSQERLLPAVNALKLPPGVSEESAAALMLKGMTAWYLLHQTFPVRPGHTLLVHAAAGGVGSILVPWAKHLGATVIGTAGSPDKAEAARRAGCDQVILYREQDFAAEVRKLTDGKGVDVAYDSVGKDTFAGSLDSLCRRGTLVTFGNASGKVPPFEPVLLSEKGSLFLTRPRLADYTATREELETAANGLFEAIAKGVVKAEVGQRYPLREVARAHAELQARQTTGASLLLP
ncbi:MAG: quinone oxidoreductase [Nevskia sp.]|nr:quinone oxidoreductase [Nevskia sp.]